MAYNSCVELKENMECRWLNSTEDRLIHATACDDGVRCVAAVTTSLVNEAAQRHQTSPTASAALGRALTAGLLLGTMLKDVERITLVFQCDGPIGGMMVDADAHGHDDRFGLIGRHGRGSQDALQGGGAEGGGAAGEQRLGDRHHVAIFGWHTLAIRQWEIKPPLGGCTYQRSVSAGHMQMFHERFRQPTCLEEGTLSLWLPRCGHHMDRKNSRRSR